MTISADGGPGPAAQSKTETTDAPAGGRSFKRIALASLIGSVIEGYDLGLFGVAAALVFPKLFFPSLGAAAATVASLATLGVAFVMRPFGAVLFGYFGDRFGRKSTLIATVLGMGVSTTLIGLLPSGLTIGVAAPIILVTLRAVQGLAIGGEWAGAVLFVTEHAPPRRRGLYAMFPQIGAAFPIALSAGTLLAVSLLVTPEAFIGWAWRVPFLASAFLVLVGLYIRLKVEETPVFAKDRKRGMKASAPLFEAFKLQPFTVLRAAGVTLVTITFVYTAQSFVANYGVTHLHLTNNIVLAATALGGLFYTGCTALSAVLSDKVGRRRIIVGASSLAVVWALVLFPVLNLGTVASYFVALCVTFCIAGLPYGAIGAFLPEQFPTRYRYTAAGISYQLTAVVGGGVAPLTAPLVIAAWGSTAFGIVLAALSAIAVFATLSLNDKGNESMDWSPDSDDAGPRGAAVASATARSAGMGGRLSVQRSRLGSR